MSNMEKYRQYFTKDYLMGPNSFRLLDELIRRKPSDVRFHRTLDLGCGFALTSLFIAHETDADSVYAYDLWVPASENYRRIRENGLEDKIIPIHGDAMDMPFAHDYFDAIISVDAYHYFGCREGVFAGKILPDVVEMDPEGILGKSVARRYDNKMPLLVKFIDARDNLSVQVHPDEQDR